MLWSKVIGAGGASGGGLSITSSYTNFVDGGSASYTIPSVGPLVGDLAIIHYTTVQGEMAATPAGWTQISLTSATSAFRQIQRVTYKILTLSDLGSVLTLATSTNSGILSAYTKTRLVTFTPSVAVTGVNISSLTVDANTVPARTKPASAFDPPTLVFAAASFYNGSNNGGYSETYWTQEYISGTSTQLITAFEIQDDVNTERTITPLFTGTALINHSFVLNVAT